MFNRLMQILAQRAMSGGMEGMHPSVKDKLMGLAGAAPPTPMSQPNGLFDRIGRAAGGMGVGAGSPGMGGMGSPMKPKMPMQKYNGGFGQMPQTQGPPDSDPQGY